jgi:glucose-1-phosphate adenylyltransferase
MAVDSNNRIRSFEEKPAMPKSIPGKQRQAYVSMGNYIFDKNVLIKILKQKYCDIASLDFGKNIIPVILKDYRTFAYDFPSNTIPGIRPYEERGYWRDVGTIESYWRTNMDMLGATPKLNLNNPRWPIGSLAHNVPPTSCVGGSIENGMLVSGCEICPGSVIRNSILSSNVIVKEGAVIEDSIIMDSCVIGRGARIRKTIIDRHNTIRDKDKIGLNKERDMQNYFVDPSGVIVVPRGKTKFL